MRKLIRLRLLLPIFYALAELEKNGQTVSTRISCGDFSGAFSRMKLALHKTKC